MPNPPKRFCLKKEYLNEAGYKNLENWIYTKNNIYIARNKQKYVKNAKEASKWENNFPEFIFGKEESLQRYQEMLESNSHLQESLPYLAGRNLGCWCEPEEECHADVIIKMFKDVMKETKRIKKEDKERKKDGKGKRKGKRRQIFLD